MNSLEKEFARSGGAGLPQVVPTRTVRPRSSADKGCSRPAFPGKSVFPGNRRSEPSKRSILPPYDPILIMHGGRWERMRARWARASAWTPFHWTCDV